MQSNYNHIDYFNKNIYVLFCFLIGYIGDILPSQNIDSKKFSIAVCEVNDGVTINVIVRPQSKKSGFTGFDSWRNRFEIKLTSPPSRGLANEELIEVVGDFFKMNLNDIEIISGLKSTQKKILLRTINLSEVISKLEEGLK